ncbi:unnamed protein product [Adineta steineri]|uniref:Translation machinery-associated protein 7 n=1 Tax=Adineta steineri TaxID=433720 RepID=A0A813TCU6_9BILA|nr:unnamed protein product [Adineta steineri]
MYSRLFVYLINFLFTTTIKMPPKAEFKPKPSAKSEKNKPKGGKAKDEKRAAEKAKKEAKLGGGPIQFGAKK